MPVKFDSRPLVLRRAFTATMRATMVVDWRQHFSHSLHLFFVVGASVIARNVANQQVLDAIGPQVLGKLYFAVAIATGLSVATVGWVGRNYDVRKITTAIHIVASMAMGAAFALPRANPALAVGKYLAMELGWSLLLLSFGLMLGARLGPRTARKSAARVGAGGIIGGLLGGVVLTVGAPLIGSHTLYLVAALLAIAPVFFLPPTTRSAAHVIHSDNPRDRSDNPALAPYGRWVAATTFLMVAATTLIDFQYRSSAKTFFNSDDMTAFFGFVVVLAGCTTVAFQLTLLDRLLDRLGLFSTAVIMPGALIVSSAAFGIAPMLATLVLLKLVDSGANMSVQQATGGLLLAPMGRRARAVWQGRIDGLAKRGGQAAMGLLITVMPLGATMGLVDLTSRLIPVTLGICALWVVAIMVTRKRYIKLLTTMLSTPTTGEPEVQAYDGATLRLLEDELAHASPPRAAVILDLMEEASHPAPKHLLRRIAETDDDGTGALLVVEHLASTGNAAAIVEYTMHAQPPIAAAALLALDNLDPEASDHCAKKFIASTKVSDILRATAAGLLASHNEQARLLMLQMCDSPNDDTRMALSGALARLHPGTAQEIGITLCKLAGDPHPETARIALGAMGKHLSPAACEVALESLKDPRLRGAGMRALADLGTPVVGPVGHALQANLHDPAIAAALTWALGNIGVTTCIAPLLLALEASHSTVRLSAAVGLTTLRRRRSQLEIPEADITAHFLREIAYYSLMRSASLCDLPNNATGTVLRRSLKQRAQASLETLFRLMSLVYPEESVQGIFQAIASRDRGQRQLALELLDTLLDAQVRHALADAIGEGGRRSSRPRNRDAILNALAKGQDAFIGELAEVLLVGDGSTPRRRDTMRPSMVDQILELQSLSLFSQASAEDLSEIAALVQERQVAKGQVIFKEGDPGDAMYLVRAGTVFLTRGKQEIARLGPGDALGIVAVLDRLPREMTATAASPCSLLLIKGGDLQQLLADRPLLMHSVFRALTDAIRNQLDRVALGQRTPEL